MSQYISPRHRIETVVARCETLLLEHPCFCSEHGLKSLLEEYSVLIAFNRRVPLCLYAKHLQQLSFHLEHCVNETKFNKCSVTFCNTIVTFARDSARELLAEHIRRKSKRQHNNGDDG